MKFASRMECLQDKALLNAMELTETPDMISFFGGFPLAGNLSGRRYQGILYSGSGPGGQGSPELLLHQRIWKIKRAYCRTDERQIRPGLQNG